MCRLNVVRCSQMVGDRFVCSRVYRCESRCVSLLGKVVKTKTQSGVFINWLSLKTTKHDSDSWHTNTHKSHTYIQIMFARRCSEFIPISCLLIKTDKGKHWKRLGKTDLLSSSVDLCLSLSRSLIQPYAGENSSVCVRAGWQRSQHTHTHTHSQRTYYIDLYSHLNLDRLGSQLHI